MSVRAYIIRDTSAKDWGDGTIARVIIEDAKPLFNVWYDEEIFDFIRYNGYDSTDNDCSGEIGIWIDEWEEAIRLSNNKTFRSDQNDIIKKINKYFENDKNMVLRLSCY